MEQRINSINDLDKVTDMQCLFGRKKSGKQLFKDRSQAKVRNMLMSISICLSEFQDFTVIAQSAFW